MIEEAKYYYFTPAGEKLGPFSTRELQDMKDSGKIPESASVLSAFNKNWHLLVDVLNGNHPNPMNRRRHLGKCPRCHQEIHSVADASYGKCPECNFPLGTPRRVSGISRNFFFTVRKRYFCFRGRAVRAEYWSFMAMTGFCAVVLGLLTFACFLLSLDGFNLHQINGRQVYELMRDAGGCTIVQYIFLGLVALIGLAFCIPACGVTVRRLHDISHTGVWFWLVFLMMVGRFAAMVGMWFGLHRDPSWVDTYEVLMHPGYTVALILAFIVVLLVLPAKDSLPGSNKYGPSPKYPYQ